MSAPKPIGAAPARLAAVLLAAPALLACRQDMHDNPRFEPLEPSSFFLDGRAGRPQVPGTVARGELRLDEHLYRGTVGGKPATDFPMRLTAEIMERGQERYEIFCTPCHDRAGYGQGMVVRRGLRQPTSLHVERLRNAPVGYFFDVITNGFGTMVDYADRLSAEDRWAVVAYLRALQLSQHATATDLPMMDRERLGGAQ